MEIQEKNVLAAYEVADESEKNLLKTLFPSVAFGQQGAKDNRPVTERIKTFEDALEALGEDNPYVAMFRCINVNFAYAPATAQMFAYAKLQVVVAALNEGWEPQFDEDEERWYPWYWLYTQEELNDKSEDWYKNRAFRKVGDEGDYKATGYAGFAWSYSLLAPSPSTARFGSRLCFKDENTATYCGTQFADLWADFYLIRK